MAQSVDLPLAVGWGGNIGGDTLLHESSDASELCLVGKLLSDKPFNKTGIRGAIYRSWHFVRDLEMEETEEDRFIFSFQS